jgi:hypothetical protein
MRALLSEPTVGEDTLSRILEVFSRYGTSLSRRLSHAVHELHRLQDRRRQEACKPVAELLVRAEDEARILCELAAQHLAPEKRIAMGKTEADPAQDFELYPPPVRKALPVSKPSGTSD